MRYRRGSLWNKWDLHVHTPASLRQSYGPNNELTWARFLDELEQLPAEIKVLGINDYIFLDGYRLVRDAKQRGRLTNIDLVLPVIELRLDRFSGTGIHWRRVNFHAIFSDSLAPDLIQAQFLNALPRAYRLDTTPPSLPPTWNALPTRESLTRLGEAIIESVPPERRSDFGPPLLEGFNNWNLNFDKVMEVLSTDYFKDNVFTAVGKAEWANMAWNDNSIADKKHVINAVHLVFTSAGSPDECVRARDSLRAAGVNYRLLDCSDAHAFAGSTQKDRLGKCFTWLNADTEFEGLKQALAEPEDRIFLGDEPEARRRVAANPTKYIRSLRIRKVLASDLPEPWFDGTDLEFNPGLIAIIGNKGSGKSALVDILGLMGNSKVQDSASFLNSTRFKRSVDNKAEHFEAEMEWESGGRLARRLSDDVDGSAVETVTYVPQRLFEEICNELAGPERGKFDLELKRVIFSHVPPASRLGCENLGELLAYRAAEIEAAIAQQRAKLREISREILRLEQRLTEEHRRTLENQLMALRAELEAHERATPEEVPPPSEQLDEAGRQTLAQLRSLTATHSAIVEGIGLAETRRTTLTRELAILDRVAQRLETMRREYEHFVSSTRVELSPLGVDVSTLARLTIDDQALPRARTPRQQELDAVGRQLTPGEPDSLVDRRDALGREISRIRSLLDAPHARHQAYVAERAAWEARHSALVGTPEELGTVAHFEAELAALAQLPGELEGLRDQRRSVALEIHRYLREIAGLYRELYEPVQRFISCHRVARERFQLRFDVAIVNARFEREFSVWINHNRVGSFCGVQEAWERVRDLLGRHNFDDSASSVAFAEAVLDQLSYDYRTPASTPTRIADQLRAGRTEDSLASFLFGFDYLHPRYGLRMGERDLHQLSPGEKGALLLVFYLLVDRSDTPLVIDQPEENLDNETIFTLLVPSVKEAKRRRQIFIVTHNPNLAIVCDAEQVIWASRGTGPEPMLRYEGGSIENPPINRRAVNVLEGTRVAFDNRKGKYFE